MPRHLNLSKSDGTRRRDYELFDEHEEFVDRFNRSTGDDLTLPHALAEALGIDGSVSVALSVTGATETWFSIEGSTYCWPSDPPRPADLERQFLRAQLDPLAYAVQNIMLFKAVGPHARATYRRDAAVARPSSDLETLYSAMA
jgi:hypothetical protein